MKPLKKWQKFAAASLAAIIMLGTTFTSSVAWFETKNDTHLDAGKGRTATAFFYSGDGETPETAYEINLPIHLYNLAWLQYMGKFNVVDGGNVTKTYFKITADLDMTGWVLPPIGTAKYPFVGELVGNGSEISNLQVDNRLSSETDAGTIVQKPSSITKLASNSEFGELNIVGVFGVVGTDNAVGSYSYSNAAPSVSNLYLNNCTVTSHASTTLGGIAAGYVAGAYMEDVGVASSTLTFAKNNAAKLSSSITNNLSDYTTIGFTKDTASIQHTETTVVIPKTNSEHGVDNGGGSESGWGGSVDMESMYNRLYNIRQNRSTGFSRGYYTATYDVYITQSIVGGITQTLTTGTETPSANTMYDNSYTNIYAYNADHVKSGYSYNPLQGEFSYGLQPDSGGDLTYNTAYMYMFGGNENYEEFQGTITTNTTTGATGYTQTSTIQVTNVNSVATSFNTYSVLGNNRYLNIQNGSISSANSASTYWAFENASTGAAMAPTTRNTPFYFFTKVDDVIYYLYAVDSNTVSITNDKDNASVWQNNNRNNRIVTTVSGSNRYLYNTGSAWTLSGSTQNLTLTRSGSVSVGIPTQQSAYINATTSAVSSGNNANNATRWVFSQRSSDSGAIYTTINDVDYFLSLSGTSVAISRDPSTRWSLNSDRLTTTIGTTTYYLRYGSNGTFSVTDDAALAGTIAVSNYTEELYETLNVTTYSLRGTANNSNRYLNASTTAVSSATSSSTNWIFENGLGASGRLYFINNNTRYYLYCSSNTGFDITDSSAEASIFTIPSSSGRISVNYNGSTHYVYLSYSYSYYNGATYTWQHAANQNFTITISSTGTQTYQYREPGTTTPTTETKNNGTKFPETYFPLSVEGDYLAAEANSGYIVSGSNSCSESYLTQRNFYGANGDIRVSKYNINTIYNALGKTSTSGVTYSDSALAVITKTYLSGGSYKRITDTSFDKTGTNGSTTLREKIPASDSYTNLGLEKYADSRGVTSTNAGLSKLLTGSSYIYGLHFVNSEIGMSNLCTAKQARMALPGKEAQIFNNFQLPRDSVDFSLKQNGFINFFAATNFPATDASNDSFFTLHEIFREDGDEDNDGIANEIVDIKEISAVYAKLNAQGRINHSEDYVYVYSGTGSPNSLGGFGAPSGYSLVFDASWISYSTGLANAWVNYAMYYFEVPVNAGEFALGSVSGHQGAYLIYLDLAANAMEYDFTNFFEYSKTIITEFEYPNGVTLVSAKGDDLDPKNSVALAVPTADTVKLSRTDDDAFAKYAKSDESVVYVGYGLTMYIGNTDPPGTKVELTDLDPVSQKTIEIKRLTTVAYNYTLKRTEITEVTATTIDNGNAEYTGRLSNNGGANWETMGDVDSTLITTTWADAENIPTGQDNMITFTALSVPVYQNGELVDVTVNLLITYERDEEATENFFQVATGYAITVVNPSTTDPLDVVVSEVYKDGDTLVYTITINGTTVTGTIPQTIPVSAAS